jgi:hypothetical protein
MSANVVPLALRHARKTIAAEAGGATLDMLQRAELTVLLAETAALSSWPDSWLIALLAGATPAERETIIRELEARR